MSERPAIRRIAIESLRRTVLAHARADAIPAATDGLWRVKKFALAKPFPVPRETGRVVTLPAGAYTQLYRLTEATMHLLGELVMQDTPDELATHLDFMLRARGRVLITGLGLGCVARGCLANPHVEHVTIVERDASVLRLVTPHMPQTDRLQIQHADARDFVKDCPAGFYDCAWHDLWTDPDKGEPHLQTWHAELVCELAGKVKLQGAWQFPKWMKQPFGIL